MSYLTIDSTSRKYLIKNYVFYHVIHYINFYAVSLQWFLYKYIYVMNLTLFFYLLTFPNFSLGWQFRNFCNGDRMWTVKFSTKEMLLL